MALEEQRAELERRHPGRRVWYVVAYDGHVTWCSREPLINADSPDHLTEAIEEADTEPEP